MLCKFFKTVWDGCIVKDCLIREAAFSEASLKKLSLEKVDFSGTDFFLTPLKGIDLSDCTIERIILSDSFRELKGATINSVQAADLIRLLGVKVV